MVIEVDGVRQHGIFSIALIAIAFTIAIAAAFYISAWHGLLCAVISCGSVICVSVVYCSKCCCRQQCNHYFIGRLSILLSKKRTDAYTRGDIIWGVGFPVMLAVFIHIYLLLSFPALLAVYCLLLISSLTDIYRYVCVKCKNTACVMCRSLNSGL